MLSPAEGRAKLARYLSEREPAPGHLNVHVTHDTILAVLVAELHGHRRITEDDWPWMMEGCGCGSVVASFTGYGGAIMATVPWAIERPDCLFLRLPT